MKVFAVMFLCLALAGCMSQEPVVETTEPWEGHYYSFKELEKPVEGQKLKDGQSIWLLSNNTLKRLLKATGK